MTASTIEWTTGGESFVKTFPEGMNQRRIQRFFDDKREELEKAAVSTALSTIKWTRGNVDHPLEVVEEIKLAPFIPEKDVVSMGPNTLNLDSLMGVSRDFVCYYYDMRNTGDSGVIVLKNSRGYYGWFLYGSGNPINGFMRNGNEPYPNLERVRENYSNAAGIAAVVAAMREKGYR